ncbi:MAG: efflux RND transporter periplasmic adaptor subunit [Anaerolineales bacterium]|nr:MAG: efflux RND transporter periplasmic adaptor subunit [Anaerolineales bacterium]
MEHKLKKILIWLSIFILIAGAVGGFLWFRQRNLNSTSANEILRAAQISYGDLTISVPASGVIVGNRASELRFTIPGMVDEVNVKTGDSVTKGQRLASIDSRDLQRAVDIAHIALEQAQLNLTSITKISDQQDIELAEVAVQDATSALAVAVKNKELAAAQAELSNRMAREARDTVQEVYLEFQKTLERYNLPYAYGAGVTAANMEADGNVGITALKGNYNAQQAESAWWAAYNGLQQAQKTLEDLRNDSDEDRVKQAELQIKQAQLNVEQAEQRLKDTVINAPYNGTITSVNIIQGLSAPIGLPALTLLDNNTLFADVSIDEIDIGKIKVAQSTEIILDAYPDVILEGIVKEIEDVPNNQSGIVSYKVRISLDDAKAAQPRDGMTASVFIKTRTVENVLLIPNWAIRTDQTTTETYVYCNCMVDGSPQRTVIDTGLRNDLYTQVLSGLEDGATVYLMTEERNLFDLAGPPPSSFGQ